MLDSYITEQQTNQFIVRVQKTIIYQTNIKKDFKTNMEMINVYLAKHSSIHSFNLKNRSPDYYIRSSNLSITPYINRETRDKI